MCSDCFSAVSRETALPYKDRPELWSEYDMADDTDDDWGIDKTEYL